jgi:hypothetical protein
MVNELEKNSPPVPLSFKERGIKGGELSAGSIGQVPSGAYFSLSGVKSQVHLRDVISSKCCLSFSCDLKVYDAKHSYEFVFDIYKLFFEKILTKQSRIIMFFAQNW